MAVDADPNLAVKEQIRAAILDGRFAPRQRLIEADLCERFGASRFQVRTALQDLAAQGLVEFQRNRGARVRDVSLSEAIEITEVRMLLEGREAARAAERVTRAQAAALRQLAKHMRTAVESGELMRYSELNVQLHATLREISGHTIAAQLLEQLGGLTVRHQFTLSLVPGRSAVSLPQHEAIVEAVVAHDPVAAERAMHEHLRSVIETFTAFAHASAS
jgi:DNA-binding GntR family transcriptional regulator